jgi:hypothetical protein
LKYRTYLTWLWPLLVVVLGGLFLRGVLVLLRGNGASAQEGAALIAGAFGLAGVTTAGFQNYLSYLERREQAVREHIFRELGRLTGGRQERNIGISVIGNYWTRLPDLQGLFVRVLANQAIFVATEGDLNKPHEYSNMTRMVDLLERARERSDYSPFFEELVQELETKRAKVPSRSQAHSGTRATKEEFDKWIERLTPSSNRTSAV